MEKSAVNNNFIVESIALINDVLPCVAKYYYGIKIIKSYIYDNEITFSLIDLEDKEQNSVELIVEFDVKDGFIVMSYSIMITDVGRMNYLECWCSDYEAKKLFLKNMYQCIETIKQISIQIKNGKIFSLDD